MNIIEINMSFVWLIMVRFGGYIRWKKMQNARRRDFSTLVVGFNFMFGLNCENYIGLMMQN